MTDIENLKLIFIGNYIPFFTDEELEYYLKDISANGLTTADMGQYFRRLANMYRPTNSGILKG